MASDKVKVTIAAPVKGEDGEHLFPGDVRAFEPWLAQNLVRRGKAVEGDKSAEFRKAPPKDK